MDWLLLSYKFYLMNIIYHCLTGDDHKGVNTITGELRTDADIFNVSNDISCWYCSFGLCIYIYNTLFIDLVYLWIKLRKQNVIFSNRLYDLKTIHSCNQMINLEPLQYTRLHVHNEQCVVYWHY